jgi:hypothetical protein
MRADSSRPTGLARRAKRGGAANDPPRRRQAVVGNASGAMRCRRKFLRHFPEGFRDEDYLALEREYKWESHLRWQAALAIDEFVRLLEQGEFRRIATKAARVEQLSRHSMIFSFEKMALRDATSSEAGAEAFSRGLFDLLHGSDLISARFERWCNVLGSLPRKQTRVLTWPLATVFGYIAQPDRHLFMKPMVTRSAARKYGFELHYRSRPGWDAYSRLLEFASMIRRDQRDLRPRDMIDLQSFIWVQGSDEYD